mmetsp:Transcript_19616/g.42590  ORF Transcript_19616/g.42590 Transcript_19616/m.42590 type:complete len:134 (-) Transcript_19616:224-625(-)
MLQTIHFTVSNFINEAVASFSSPYFDRDGLWAMGIGIVLGLIVLLVLTAFPGENAMIRPADTNDDKIQKTKTNERQMENDSISIFKILNLLVYFLFFSGITYYLNRDYDNIATKWFATTFPREAETLGLHVEL